MLFVLAVDQFKEHATKTKAVTIFDTFIGNGGLWGEPLGELDPKNVAHAAIVNTLEARVGWFRELQQEANSMNIFQRIWTSSSRAVALPVEFDYFIAAAKLEGKLGDQLVGLLTFIGDVTPLNGWDTVARAAKKQLKDAGFDLYRLGMTGIC